MSAIYFNHLSMLWLFLAAIPLLLLTLWYSRAGLNRWGKVAVVLVRLLIIAAGIIALSDPVIHRTIIAQAHPSLFLLEDRSFSMGDDPQITSAINQILQAAKLPVVQLMFAGRTWDANEPPRNADQTNIEAALNEVAGRSSELNGAQIVLLTDGRQTQGQATDAAAQLAVRGAKVHVIPVGIRREHPPRVVAVDAPLGAKVGVPVGVRVSIEAANPGSAVLRLLDPSHKVVDQRTIALPGRSTAMLHLTPTDGGMQDYTVQVDTDGALVDSRSVPIYVQGPPRILLADNVPDEAFLLSKSIQELKMPVDIISAGQWPDDLTPYAAVILSDWLGNELTPDQRGRLKQYVEVTGGGLIFIAGSDTQASRWANNPLRELLPIHLRERPARVIRQQPDVSIVYVLDSSGSMSSALPGSAGSVSKLELVKASAIASLQAMSSLNATIGVIEFSSSARIIVPPTSIKDRTAIAKSIDSISLGGGTNMYPGIQQGLDMLKTMPGDKYLVVLTDGDSIPPPGGGAWDDLPRAARAAGISWTSIAVGHDANQSLMQHLARQAGGRYVYCDTSDQIPRVFIEQAKAIRRVSEIKQPAFTPLPGPDAAELTQIDPAALPQLFGRIPADARPGVKVQLLASGHDPLLATWQFGLGRVTAFCSDAKNLWAKQWLDSSIFPLFWTEIVARAARPPRQLHATVHQIRRDNQVQLIYRVLDDQGHPVEDISTGATVTPPLPAPPVWSHRGPGYYQLTLDLPPDGAPHDLDVTLQRSRQQSAIHHITIYGTPGVELAATGPDEQACAQIAAAGEGICSSNLDTILAAINQPPVHFSYIAQQPLRPLLLIFMIGLWPLDIFLRKML